MYYLEDAERIRDLERQRDAYSDEIDSLEGELAACQERLAALDAENETLAERNDEAKALIGKLETENQRYRDWQREGAAEGGSDGFADAARKEE